MATIATVWRNARSRYADRLDKGEEAETNAATQEFLAATALLAEERRPSRRAYLARRA